MEATAAAVKTSSTTAATVTAMLGKGRDRENERERSEACKDGSQQGGFRHSISLHRNDGSCPGGRAVCFHLTFIWTLNPR
jgi:hypothetical protein